MEPVALRPLGIGEILDVAIKIYRAHFVTLARAVATVVTPIAIVSAIVQVSSGASASRGSFNFAPRPNPAATFDTHALWTALAGTLVVFLLQLVATQLAVGASFKAIGEGYLGGEPDWRTSIRFALDRFGSLLWMTLILDALVFLGFVACLVPGIYFYGAWTVAVPVLLLENIKGRKALKRSRQLVSGRWWPTAGAVFVGSLLASVASAALSGIVLGVAASGANDVVRAFVNAVVSVATLSLTTPFTAAVAIVVYFDLRVRKEGYDLELLAQGIGVAPPIGARPSVLPPPPRPMDDDQPPFWPPPPGWRPGGGSGPGA